MCALGDIFCFCGGTLYMLIPMLSRIHWFCPENMCVCVCVCVCVCLCVCVRACILISLSVFEGISLCLSE